MKGREFLFPFFGELFEKVDAGEDGSNLTVGYASRGTELLLGHIDEGIIGKKAFGWSGGLHWGIEERLRR